MVIFPVNDLHVEGSKLTKTFEAVDESQARWDASVFLLFCAHNCMLSRRLPRPFPLPRRAQKPSNPHSKAARQRARSSLPRMLTSRGMPSVPGREP